MRLANFYHIILITIIAPFCIGAGYSLVSGDLKHWFVAGCSIIVYGLIVTIPLATVSLIIWKITDYCISKTVCTVSGIVIGSVLGACLSYIFEDNKCIFFILSGVFGGIIGFSEFFLFKNKC